MFFPKGPIYDFQHFFNNGMVPTRWRAIIWTNVDPVNWRIYVAQGGDELILCYIIEMAQHTHYITVIK